MKKLDHTPLRGSRLKVKTAVSLSKTKPLKENKIQRLKKKMVKAEQKVRPDIKDKQERVKPVSQIELKNKLETWLIPARIGYFLNGFYYLVFSAISFLAIFSGNSIVKPFFTLPFETSFSSYFLLEMAAVFAFLVSIMFFHASCSPKNYRWLYFLMLIVYMPYHFFSNLQKMQIELPADFQNYLYFDTIVMAIFWGAYLISFYPYIKLKTLNK